MFNQENISMKGELTIERFDISGQLVEKRKIPNLVVTSGKSLMISRLLGTTDGVMTHMGVGTGVTSPVVGNTALETALGARIALTSATQSSNSVTYVGTFAAGVSTGAITEAGIFNALTSGTMLCRTVFPVVNKAAGDSIIITWLVTIS
jgi:hypothetical protein